MDSVKNASIRATQNAVKTKRKSPAKRLNHIVGLSLFRPRFGSSAYDARSDFWSLIELHFSPGWTARAAGWAD